MNQRQIPGDFQTFAIIETNDQLRKRYNVGGTALYRWLAECGLDRTKRKKRSAADHIPEWFAEAARESGNAELAERSGVCLRTIKYWRSILSIAAKRDGREPPNKLYAPGSFAQLAPTMTRNALRLHYGRSLNTIDRWCREAGVRPKRAPLLAVERSSRVFNPPAQTVYRDDSPAGRAADYLRKYGPVIRCDQRGSYDPNGGHWRRGSTILAPQDVIERAERLGWAA